MVPNNIEKLFLEKRDNDNYLYSILLSTEENLEYNVMKDIYNGDYDIDLHTPYIHFIANKYRNYELKYTLEDLFYLSFDEYDILYMDIPKYIIDNYSTKEIADQLLLIDFYKNGNKKYELVTPNIYLEMKQFKKILLQNKEILEREHLTDMLDLLNKEWYKKL